ncbi:hypothetical protein CSUB01_09652 [Colletotrichum sublineola]|uniref:Uncharacterized protein n=1 Tax=Colletotrichum sublineola TaxID=1173701 RepID=A0A066WWU1_COLSU|nr:hypothetical protein CSUB01_09652 [Colletotrichum sublineola]
MSQSGDQPAGDSQDEEVERIRDASNKFDKLARGIPDFLTEIQRGYITPEARKKMHPTAQQQQQPDSYDARRYRRNQDLTHAVQAIQKAMAKTPGPLTAGRRRQIAASVAKSRMSPVDPL